MANAAAAATDPLDPTYVGFRDYFLEAVMGCRPHTCRLCHIPIDGLKVVCDTCLPHYVSERVPSAWGSDFRNWWLLGERVGGGCRLWPVAQLTFNAVWFWNDHAALHLHDFPGVRAWHILGCRSSVAPSGGSAFLGRTHAELCAYVRSKSETSVYVWLADGTVTRHAIRCALTEHVMRGRNHYLFQTTLWRPRIDDRERDNRNGVDAWRTHDHSEQLPAIQCALKTPAVVQEATGLPRDLCMLVVHYCWPAGASDYRARKVVMDRKATEINAVKTKAAAEIARLTAEWDDLERQQTQTDEAFAAHVITADDIRKGAEFQRQVAHAYTLAGLRVAVPHPPHTEDERDDIEDVAPAAPARAVQTRGAKRLKLSVA